MDIIFQQKTEEVQLLCYVESGITKDFLTNTTIIALKSDSHLPRKICFICFNESPLQMTKNAFYFILKALFILKVFNFLSGVFGHLKKRLDFRTIRLISKFVTSQPG